MNDEERLEYHQRLRDEGEIAAGALFATAEWTALLSRDAGCLRALVHRNGEPLFLWWPEGNFAGCRGFPVDLSKAPRLAAFLNELNGVVEAPA